MNFNGLKKAFCITAIACLIILYGGYSFASITFEEVSDAAGIYWGGFYTFSISWTDFDGDGLPDLFASPHGYNFDKGRFPKLFLNKGDGTFIDVAQVVFEDREIVCDTHGVSWVDFDGDDDPDLMVLVGAESGLGKQGNLFFVNHGGKLQEEAAQFGLDYEIARGRSSLWFDLNADAQLDVLLLNAKRQSPPALSELFIQKPSGFLKWGLEASLISQSARFATLSDVTADGKCDLVVHGTYRFPLSVIDLRCGRTNDVSDMLPAIMDPSQFGRFDFKDHRSARDVVIQDFNGDLYPDIYITRSLHTGDIPCFIQFDDFTVFAALSSSQELIGLDLHVEAPIRIELQKRQFDFDEVKVVRGANGTTLEKRDLVLNQNKPVNWGISDPPSGVKRALSIGYDPNSGLWSVRYRGFEDLSSELLISSDEPIQDVQTVGFDNPEIDPSNNALSDILWIYDPVSRKYVDRTEESGLSSPTPSQSVVAGDFDNDMDVDLYLSCSTPYMEVPDIVYENQGDGTFIVAADTGAESRAVYGVHGLEFGIGSRVAVADYDLDGFLDLYHGATGWVGGIRTHLATAPTLYRNVGNANHWIEIDLQGTSSNREGIGARVTVTAGGVSRLGEMSGGMHLFGQNMPRLHFGLAGNEKIDSLEIRWPSGIRQILTDVPSNQIITIQEEGKVYYVDDCGNDNASTGKSGAGGGGCFIATAAYGSRMAEEVVILRDFRNRFLLTNFLGRSFVKLYYEISPSVAGYIAGHDTLISVVRWSLLPLVGLSWITLKIGLVPTLVPTAIFLVTISVCLLVLLRKIRLKSRTN